MAGLGSGALRWESMSEAERGRFGRELKDDTRPRQGPVAGNDGFERLMTSLRALMVSASAAAFAAGAAAHAADPVKLDVEGEASVAAGLADGDAKADANAEVSVKGSTVLDNGLELGAVVSARLDADQPRQLFGGGRYSSQLIGGPRGVAPTLMRAARSARSSSGAIRASRAACR